MVRFRIILILIFISPQVFGQFYYTIGPKVVYSKFSYFYKNPGAYEWDSNYSSWVSSDSVDFVKDKGANFGICATLGYSFDLKDSERARGLAEGQGFIRFLRFPKDYGSYSDFSIRAGRIYSVGRARDLHRVFGLLGLGYSSSDGFKEVKLFGFNYSLGYENVSSNYVVGVRLTGNIFVHDFYSHHQAFLSQLKSRRMSTIGLTFYVGSIR